MSDETPTGGFPFTFGDTGCQHQENDGASKCNKVCDPGQTLCPFHRLLADNPPDTTKAKPPKTVQSFKTPRAYRE